MIRRFGLLCTAIFAAASAFALPRALPVADPVFQATLTQTLASVPTDDAAWLPFLDGLETESLVEGPAGAAKGFLLEALAHGRKAEKTFTWEATPGILMRTKMAAASVERAATRVPALAQRTATVRERAASERAEAERPRVLAVTASVADRVHARAARLPELYGDERPLRPLAMPGEEIDAVAVDREGRVYAAQRSEGRIRVWDRHGRAERTIEPELPEELGEIRLKPNAIAVSPTNGRLFVSDPLRNLIHELEPDGRYVRSLGENELAGAPSLAVDAQGRLLAADPRMDRLLVFGEGPSPAQVFTGGVLKQPMAIAPTEHGALIANAGHARVDSIEFRTGKLQTLAERAMLQSMPTGVARGPDGRLFIAVASAHAVLAIEPDGRRRVLGQGRATREASGFDKPYGIAVGPGGKVYVADKENDRIGVWQPLLGSLIDALPAWAPPQAIEKALDAVEAAVALGLHEAPLWLAGFGTPEALEAGADALAIMLAEAAGLDEQARKHVASPVANLHALLRKPQPAFVRATALAAGALPQLRGLWDAMGAGSRDGQRTLMRLFAHLADGRLGRGLFDRIAAAPPSKTGDASALATFSNLLADRSVPDLSSRVEASAGTPLDYTALRRAALAPFRERLATTLALPDEVRAKLEEDAVAEAMSADGLLENIVALASFTSEDGLVSLRRLVTELVESEVVDGRFDYQIRYDALSTRVPPELLAAWSFEYEDEVGGTIRLHATGDPALMIKAGDEPVKTCQRCAEAAELNTDGEPIHKVLLGQFRIANWHQNGRLAGRSFLELARDSMGRDVLLVEKLYQDGDLPRDLLLESMLEYGRALGVAAVYFGDEWPVPAGTQKLVYKLHPEGHLILYRDSFMPFLLAEHSAFAIPLR